MVLLGGTGRQRVEQRRAAGVRRSSPPTRQIYSITTRPNRVTACPTRRHSPPNPFIAPPIFTQLSTFTTQPTEIHNRYHLQAAISQHASPSLQPPFLPSAFLQSLSWPSLASLHLAREKLETTTREFPFRSQPYVLIRRPFPFHRIKLI